MEIDLKTYDNNFKLVEGIDAAKILIERTILTVRQELQYYQNVGVDYFNTLYNPNTNIVLFQNSIIKNLIKLPFIKEIKKFDFNIENNIFRYTLEVQTNFGDISIKKRMVGRNGIQ